MAVGRPQKERESSAVPDLLEVVLVTLRVVELERQMCPWSHLLIVELLQLAGGGV